MADVVIRTEIEGADVVTPYLKREVLTVIAKKEEDIYLEKKDGWFTIPIDKLRGTIKRIMVYPQIQGLNPAPVTTVRLVINNGVNPQYNIDIPILDELVFAPHGDLLKYLKSIALATTNTSKVQIDLRIFTV